MYSASHPASTSINGMGSDMIDPSGTINPAALNTTGISCSFLIFYLEQTCARLSASRQHVSLHGKVESPPQTDRIFCHYLGADAFCTVVSVLPTPSSVSAHDSSPRGIKRSRSPDLYGEIPHGGEGEDGTWTGITQSTVFNGSWLAIAVMWQLATIEGTNANPCSIV